MKVLYIISIKLERTEIFFFPEPKKKATEVSSTLKPLTKKRLKDLLKMEVQFYEWIKSRLLNATTENGWIALINGHCMYLNTCMKSNSECDTRASPVRNLVYQPTRCTPTACIVEKCKSADILWWVQQILEPYRVQQTPARVKLFIWMFLMKDEDDFFFTDASRQTNCKINTLLLRNAFVVQIQ